MACRPIKNKDGQITGIAAANGQRSELFDSLSDEKKLGPAIAYQIYADLRLKKFTDWFGAKWDTPSDQPTQQDSEVDNIDYIDETLYNKNVNQTPEGTEFINVYRAEGEVTDKKNLPLSARGNAGSWFTPFKAEAERYAAM